MKKISLLTVLYVVVFCFICAGNTQQEAGAAKHSTGGPNALAVTISLDSAIGEIAKEIQYIINREEMDKDDSVHLKELSSRMRFLSELNNNIKGGSTSSGTAVQQVGLSISILVFGLLLMLTLLIFQFRNKREINHNSFKLIGMLFIGTVSVFLIPAGFDNNQITPVIGLLGTLAGYLIGTSKDRAEPVAITP